MSCTKQIQISKTDYDRYLKDMQEIEQIVLQIQRKQCSLPPKKRTVNWIHHTHKVSNHVAKLSIKQR